MQNPNEKRSAFESKYSRSSIVVFSCTALLIVSSHFKCMAEVALPRLELIGANFETLSNCLQIFPTAILPQAIRLELGERKILAIVCEYPETVVSYASVKSQLEKSIKLPAKVDSSVTAAWRLEAEKCAVMVTWDKDAKITTIIVRAIGKT